MKRILQGQEAMLLRCGASGLIRMAAEEACEFHRSVNSFGAAVRKKDAVHSGPRCQFAPERALIRVMKKIRKVNGARRFAAHYLYDARMRLAERVSGDSANKSRVTFSRGIENVCAAAGSHDHRLALIGGPKK